jgi:transcription initiation factor TFIID subunit 3
VLKKKHSTTTDEDTRYTGTVLGKPTERRTIKVEGSEISSLKEWAERMRNPTNAPSALSSSRRQSSELSTLGDEEMEDLVS